MTRLGLRCAFVAGCVAVGNVAWAAAADEARPAADSQRQGNVFGINLGVDGHESTVATARLLGLARTLVGDWGYLRPGVADYDDLAALKRAVAMIRAHRLIPIGGGAHVPEDWREPGRQYARLDPDGTMRSAARARARLWRAAYEARIPLYCVEVLNEVNIDKSWPPEKYAQWLHDFAIEVKQAYPGLKVCSAGMAGSGAEYYDAMLEFEPRLKELVDFWGLHPYPANHPPEYKSADVCLSSYRSTEAVLRKHGVKPIRMMCTETGYELEMGSTGKDPAYPPIKEDNRAGYMARGFRELYMPEPRIEVVAPFMLWDLNWHNWDGWQFMEPDGRPKPIYDAVAAEPKTPGRDWLVGGPARIEGRITWGDTGLGVPRVVVYVEPGLYGGVTDDAGRFEIRDLPEGAYQIRAFADGFEGAEPRTIRVTAAKAAQYSARLQSESIVPHFFGEPGGPLPGRRPASWSPMSADMDKHCDWQLDSQVRFRQVPTVRVRLDAEGKFGLWNYGPYHSAYPSEVYIAEINVRGPASGGRGATPWIELSACSGRGSLLSTARATYPDFRPDGKWYRITAAVLAPPTASRLRLTFGADGGEGTLWFSAPYVGEADFPLPGDASLRTTGYVPPLYDVNRRLFAQTSVDLEERNPSLEPATISGQVKDFRGLPLASATVATDVPLFVTVTDRDGRYTLTVPAGRKMRLRAFAREETPAISGIVTAGADRDQVVNLQTAAPDAPATLSNGDFNRFTRNAPGLLRDWTSFGTTDGTTASGQTIFSAKSFEGEGFYYAQAGSNTKNGGAYQIVQAEPNARYRLTGMVYTRTEGGDMRPLDNNCRLGVDPTGGRNPDSPDVVWTPPTESEQSWKQLQVEVTARTTRMTVFLRHEMRRANIWNLTCFDDLRLEKLE